MTQTRGDDDRTTARLAGMSVEDVAGTVAARQALGPDAEEAVIREFLDRTGREIDIRVEARVEARLSEWQRTHPVSSSSGRPSRHNQARLALAIVSLSMSIPLTAITMSLGNGFAGPAMALVVWAGIIAVNVAYAIGSHRGQS